MPYTADRTLDTFTMCEVVHESNIAFLGGQVCVCVCAYARVCESLCMRVFSFVFVHNSDFHLNSVTSYFTLYDFLLFLLFISLNVLRYISIIVFRI